MPIELPQSDEELHALKPAIVETVGAVTYEGFARFHSTQESDAEWGIRRTTYVSGTKVVTWALAGRFDCVWNSRSTYFSAGPTGLNGTFLFSGTVGTSALLLPVVSGPNIKNFSARSSSENPATRRLEVSIDGGTNLWVLRPGAEVSGDIEGAITQIWVRAQASTIAYEVAVTLQ